MAGKFGRSPASSVTAVAAAAAALRSAVSLSEVSWRMASSMSPHFSRMEDTSCGFDARNGAVSVQAGSRGRDRGFGRPARAEGVDRRPREAVGKKGSS